LGGHRVSRNDACYKKVALLSKLLTEGGYLVASGGGPGIMEAANLGAFLADKSDNTVTDAIEHMSGAPVFTDPKFSDLAIEVFHNYNSEKASLSIPTWFYGHEPSNVFSTAIAKYFSNSIREDTLLAICMYGVIFAPGSAGTTQEIFMDAAQNHYGTYNFYSPMVFLDSEHYEYETMIYPLLKRMARGQAYEKLLFLSDDPQRIVNFLIDHPPIPTTSRKG
jgi:predicted Rossmann-fold nucleotide-binding protein